MKLNEKIAQCRRRAGLSQEALAEKIGVSRQAISKWETGEASPEIGKLPLLAKTFGVTADWLLNEEEEASGPDADPASRQEEPPRRQYSDESPRSIPAWVDHLPGILGQLVKRWGWLVGVYVALGGAGTTLLGVIGLVISGAMSSSMQRSADTMAGMFGSAMPGMNSVTFFDPSGNMVDPGRLGLDAGAFGSTVSSAVSAVTEPFGVFCGILIVLGLLVAVAGCLLAWKLKKMGKSA